MADGSRWRDFGRYRAQGISGGDALGYGIERMVTGIRSAPDSLRGVRARANYLSTAAGREAMREAGITATPRTVAAWQAGTRLPTRANRARLDSAYWTLRRRNVAADLKRRLYNGGRGTRVEIDPADQSQVHLKHRRALNTRHLTIRPHHWDTAVDAWLHDDDRALKDLWDNEITPDLGTDYDAYTYVSSVGWAS
jgi:hypothetical protein